MVRDRNVDMNVSVVLSCIGLGIRRRKLRYLGSYWGNRKGLKVEDSSLPLIIYMDVIDTTRTYCAEGLR